MSLRRPPAPRAQGNSTRTYTVIVKRRFSRPGLALALVCCLFGCTKNGSDGTMDCLPQASIVDLNSDASPIHDPSVIEADQRFYLYSSSPLGSFYISNDLRDWQLAGTVFKQLPEWLREAVPVADHIGSPDIHHYRGRYVLFYQSHKGNTCHAATGLATNTTLDPSHPDYSWRDHGLVIASEPFLEDLEVYCGSDLGTFNAIDASLFIDQDDTPYLVFGSTIGGIKLIELDSDTLKPKPDAELITLAQRFLFQDDPIIEAPFVFFKGGYYYLFVSFNHCCRGADTRYQVRVGRAQNLSGPYTDRQGRLMTLGGGTLLLDGDGTWIGTGHAEVLHHQGTDWLVHHAKNPAEEYRAYLNVRPLHWPQEPAGWPALCQKTMGR